VLLDLPLVASRSVFPLTSGEEQIRVGKNGIVKRHSKFFYDSPVFGRQSHILLFAAPM
jgi:hypothetical protein